MGDRHALVKADSQKPLAAERNSRARGCQRCRLAGRGVRSALDRTLRSRGYCVFVDEGDNLFGTPEEDARRRDFTINALFYDPLKKTLLDFAGGLDDLKHGIVRMIGDPEQRYREDRSGELACPLMRAA